VDPDLTLKLLTLFPPDSTAQRNAFSNSRDASLWASRYLTITGHAMPSPCADAHAPLMGRVPGITTARSGMAAPLSRIVSFTQSYTGIDFDKVTPGAMTAAFLTR